MSSSGEGWKGSIPPRHQVEVLREVLRVPVPTRADPDEPRRQPILEAYLGRFLEGLAVVAPDGRIRLFSQGLEHITGVAASEVTDIGELITSLAPDTATGAAQLERFLDGQAQEESNEQLIEIVNRRGEHRWLRGRLYRVSEDTIVHVLDITAIHTLRGTTPHSAEHYQTLLDNLDVGVYCITDPASGKVAFANPACRRILGIPLDADLAQFSSFAFYERPEDRMRLAQALMADGFAQSRTVRFETRLLRLDTRAPVDVRLTSTATYDEQGYMMRVDALVEDISERRRFEVQKAEHELLVGSLFEDTAVGIVIGTLDGRILAANPAFCAMVGFSEEELMGHEVDRITHPNDKGQAVREIRSNIAQGRKMFSYQKRYVRKDGTVFRANVTLAGVQNAKGEPAAGIALVEWNGEDPQPGAPTRTA